MVVQKILILHTGVRFPLSLFSNGGVVQGLVTSGFQSDDRGSSPRIPAFNMVASANWYRLPELHSGLCGFDSHRHYSMCSASIKTGRGAPLRMTVARP